MIKLVLGFLKPPGEGVPVAMCATSIFCLQSCEPQIL